MVMIVKKLIKELDPDFFKCIHAGCSGYVDKTFIDEATHTLHCDKCFRQYSIWINKVGQKQFYIGNLDPNNARIL